MQVIKESRKHQLFETTADNLKVGDIIYQCNKMPHYSLLKDEIIIFCSDDYAINPVQITEIKPAFERSGIKFDDMITYFGIISYDYENKIIYDNVKQGDKVSNVCYKTMPVLVIRETK